MKIENAISILEGMEKTTGNANVAKVPLQMAIEALKKQISYRPWCDFSEDEKLENSHWFCKKCGWAVEENQNYCPECGQKIDWD